MSAAIPDFGLNWPVTPHTPLIQRHFWCALHHADEKYRHLHLDPFFHRKAIQQALWSEDFYAWHAWRERRLRGLCERNWLTWAGPGGSAKTTDSAAFAVQYYLEAPHQTAVIVCSTTMKMLRKRIWNEITKFFMNLPKAIEFRDEEGNLIERTPRGYVGELIDSDTLIRWQKGDTKNGIFGIAVEEGPVEEAIQNLVGIHTHRVFLMLDEMQGVRAAIMGATRNMSKNPVFKFLGMGNPESRLDPHGKASEPIAGWNSVVEGETEEWETRGGPVPGNGLCQQFYGLQSPAVLDPEWGAKHPWMINQSQIDAHLKDVGGNENDPSFASQAKGIWPAMGLESTLLDDATIQMFRVRERAVWTHGFKACAALDPAFNGGDDAILQFGKRGEVEDDLGKRWQIGFDETVKVPLDSTSSRPIHYQMLDFVKAECEKRNIPADEFALDASGEGGGLKAIFEQEWGAVIGIESGGAASELPVDESGKTANEAYDNRSSELCFSLRAFAMRNGIRNLPDEAAKQASARRTFYRNGKWCVEPKRGSKGRTDEKGRPVKGFKERLGYSPDEIDACDVLIEHCRQKGAYPASVGAASHQSADEWNKMARKAADDFSEENYLKEQYAETH